MLRVGFDVQHGILDEVFMTAHGDIQVRTFGLIDRLSPKFSPQFHSCDPFSRHGMLHQGLIANPVAPEVLAFVQSRCLTWQNNRQDEKQLSQIRLPKPDKNELQAFMKKVRQTPSSQSIFDETSLQEALRAARLVNNQAACKRLIDSMITINPTKSSSPILIFQQSKLRRVSLIVQLDGLN
jgi:hypothetical protein